MNAAAPFRRSAQLFGPLTVALLLAGCGGSGNAQETVPATGMPSTPNTLTPPNDYRLVWSDEFSGDGPPDTGRWSYDTGLNKQGWHNRELQYYSNARTENADVRDGMLVITARKEKMDSAQDWGGQAYTSARLMTQGKAQWTYGFFEVRARLPCGKGSWPAIWMLGSGGDWPAVGELDILEQVGSDPSRVFSTVHTSAGSGSNGAGAATQVADACTRFHRYQMHWTARQIQFGVDGTAHFTYTNQGKGRAQWPFSAPQFLILNLAVGGDLGGPVDDSIFPIQMEIDYVRVYQKRR
jgi:beta-glucanase (GH16 family)